LTTSSAKLTSRAATARRRPVPTGRKWRPDPRDTLQDRGAVPGETIELEETRRQLAKAIQRLDERERKVLTLYYYEGLNLAEIGEILGVTGAAPARSTPRPCST